MDNNSTTDYRDCLKKPGNDPTMSPPVTTPTEVGTDRYITAKFKFSMLAKIRSGEIQGMVDKEGNYYEKDEIYINTTPEGSTRKKVVFGRFCKTARIDPQKLNLKKCDFFYLYILTNTVDKNNTVNFDNLNIEELTLSGIRSRLRKAGLIDKLKIYHTKKWYMNPFYCTTTKTIDIRLYEHFLDKIDYCIT